MNYPRKEIVNMLKEDYPRGCRVELIDMNDVQAPPPGTKGTVSFVDSAGTVHVNWDNGSSLGAVYGEDSIKRI